MARRRESASTAVSRAFSAFRKRGWIRLHGQSGVELVNRPSLAALASGEGTDR